MGFRSRALLGTGDSGCGIPATTCGYRRARLASAVFCVLYVLAGASRVASQDNTSGEYQVKAAFLFHFAEFVEWPAEAFKDGNSPLTYCTVGADPFRGALDDSLRGKTIGERIMRVQHLKQLDAIHGCQILFIGATEDKRASSILANVKGTAVLTVGESHNFAEDGGMIEFLLEGNKIRFEINLGAVNAAKLKMSARLLTLAKTVIGTAGEN